MTEFEMTDAQFEEILQACQPVPLIALQCGPAPTQQDYANRAWQKLGAEMGFVWDTVRPITGKGQKFFLAKPLERN